MILAKTTRPSAMGAVTRPRLFRLLARREARLVTWIWGPPGAGKTTLMSSFVASRKSRALWYTVDASDADPATFFHYLGQAAPRRPAPLPPLTPELRESLPAFTRRWMRDLYGRLRTPFVLVLDNYHELQADAALHEVLREAAEELPGAGRIVIISRAAPPQAFARLRVHGALQLVGWDDLRLTVTETRQVAARYARRAVSTSEVRRLHDLAQGWIAGLVLLLAQHGVRGSHEMTAAPEVLFDYFASEIFERVEPRVQHVLLATSFLPTIRPESAAALTGAPEAAAIVTNLHAAGYFTDRGAADGAGYHYHPLYRAFLQARAAQTYPPDALNDIRARAARLSEEGGEIEAAATLLRTAGAWPALRGLVVHQAPLLLAQGRVETLEQWIGWVPESLLERDAWLLCWRSLCRMGRVHEACRRDAEAALALFRAGGERDGALVSWSTVVTSCLMQGRLEPLDRWIPLLDELLRETSGPTSEDIDARVASAMLLAIFYRRPSHPDGPAWAERARAATRDHPDALLRAVAAFGWVFYQWAAGDPGRAHLAVDDMRALQAASDVSPLAVLYACVPIAWHEFLSGTDGYIRTVAATLEIAGANGLESHAVVASVLFAGALAALSDDHLEIARACVEQLSGHLEGFGDTHAVAYHCIVIRQAIADGAVERALRSADALERLGSGFPLEPVCAHGTIAWLHWTRGQPADALAHAEAAVRAAQEMGTPFARWMAALVHAHVLFAGGREEEGMHALRSAMETGRAGGYVNSQLWIPSMMAGLCARALEAGIEPDYVRSLVRRRRLLRYAPSADVEGWPWPIRILTSTPMSILVEGRPLVWHGKLPRKPLALLQLLIERGPGGARDEIVMDQLWPDAEGDAARRALATAVFRLRRLLGQDEAVIRDDGVLRLDAGRCWVDLWAVDSLLGRAQRLSENDPQFSTRGVRWIERAATLFEATAGAGEHPRDHHPRRRRVAWQLLRAARSWERAGDPAQAQSAVERALALEPADVEARDLIDRLRDQGAGGWGKGGRSPDMTVD